MESQNNINTIIENTVGDLKIDELMLLYRIHNYLIQITERPLQNLFLTDTEEHGKLLRTAIEQSSASEIRSEAHRIKGGAVQIGAESLGALAAVLENAGRENALMDTKAQLVDFEQEYSRVREFLELEIQS